MRYSGLQKEVFSLYRQCLRACQKKSQDARPHFLLFTRKEFEKNRCLSKKDFVAIEYLLRKGHRQLELYSSSGIRDIRV
ncbi:Succinate dehydrogenase assembly factor 1, mitochondrial [Golovinomyces cichoracearum]|uniref:Succinate dehydrogenase assembly factor 1, mitochondrial n=1 Tax=Golovinomyces cichoracearum TaxID=62708 RepID=A0A420IVV7_9PEZI|nr:Succinate dehydrogenase assembly factor 1, mitochondrial [Golovinomyces cichoracearum]